jgi:hypothetical protein
MFKFFNRRRRALQKRIDRALRRHREFHVYGTVTGRFPVGACNQAARLYEFQDLGQSVDRSHRVCKPPVRYINIGARAADTMVAQSLRTKGEPS